MADSVVSQQFTGIFTQYITEQPVERSKQSQEAAAENHLEQQLNCSVYINIRMTPLPQSQQWVQVRISRPVDLSYRAPSAWAKAKMLGDQVLMCLLLDPTRVKDPISPHIGPIEQSSNDDLPNHHTTSELQQVWHQQRVCGNVAQVVPITVLQLLL